VQSIENSNPCIRGAFCYNSTVASAPGVPGICTAFNAIPIFEDFSFPASPRSEFSSASLVGSSLCASGLAVPANNSGYTSSTKGRCIAKFNFDKVRYQLGG
jgi:hypothetical protein